MRMTKVLTYYVLLPGLIGALLMLLHPSHALWNEPELTENEVTLSIVESWNEPVIWIDARSVVEYEKERIPKAISLSPEVFESNIILLLNEWEPGVRIVVYCDTQLCDASHETALRLSDEVGLPDVYVLYDGWKSWKKSKH